MKNKVLFGIALLIISAKIFGQEGYTILSAKLPFSTEVMDYYVKRIGTNYILNGDIIVGSTLQRTAIYQSNNTQDGYLWPRGGVPVKIDLSMYRNNNERGMDMSAMALRAIDDLNSATNIRLVPYTGQKDYIRIMYTSDIGYGGISPIGRIGGEQIIYITRQSTSKTIVHELMHSLGFWHEQSRHDRDSYIKINWSNIDSTKMHNFQIEPGTTSGAYDYESVMHYHAKAFAKDTSKVTIQCKNGNVISDCVFGSYYVFSDKDIAGINTTYFYNAGTAAINYEAELSITETVADVMKQQQKRISPVVKEAQRQQITEGLYKIKINQTGRHLAIEGVSKENGARLVQWDYVDQNNHKFYVTKRADNTFTLWGWDSRKYVCAASGNKEDGTAVVQDSFADYLGTWKIEYSNQNGCKPGWVITNVVSGKPLHLVGDGNGAGFEIRAQKFLDGEYDCASTFQFESLGDIPAELKSPESVPAQKINSPAIQKMKKNN
ncbi:MAG: RICIN domain-containing protein [Ferruginibacter sp.]|nr:RICIN domain-containing protein [Chitinophagaceae bacterium]